MSEIPMIVEFMEKIDGYREARLEQQSKLDSLTEAGVFLLTCMHELEAENERLNLVDTLYKELLEHEQQTHNVLGEILGTDDSLEVLARRVVERIKELEHIAELAMEWSARYPPGKQSWKTNARIANVIYDACEQAGIGQAEKENEK